MQLKGGLCLTRTKMDGRASWLFRQECVPRVLLIVCAESRPSHLRWPDMTRQENEQVKRERVEFARWAGGGDSMERS